MNKDIKKRWIEALRSGEYEQAKSELRNNICNSVSGAIIASKFCCLGVLCDIHSKETNTEWLGEYYLSGGEFLPTEVREWAGLEGRNPLIPSAKIANEGPTSLTAANDDGFTFPQIADIIEKEL